MQIQRTFTPPTHQELIEHQAAILEDNRIIEARFPENCILVLTPLAGVAMGGIAHWMTGEPTLQAIATGTAFVTGTVYTAMGVRQIAKKHFGLQDKQANTLAAGIGGFIGGATGGLVNYVSTGTPAHPVLITSVALSAGAIYGGGTWLAHSCRDYCLTTFAPRPETPLPPV